MKGGRVVYSTRWFDHEADQADRPRQIRDPLTHAYDATTHDERHQALSQPTTLRRFLRTEVRSHPGASL